MPYLRAFATDKEKNKNRKNFSVAEFVNLKNLYKFVGTFKSPF